MNVIKKNKIIIAGILTIIGLCTTTYLLRDVPEEPMADIVVLATQESHDLSYTLAMKMNNDNELLVRLGTRVGNDERVDHYLNESIDNGDGLEALDDWLQDSDIPDIDNIISVVPDALAPSITLHMPNKIITIIWYMDQVVRGKVISTRVDIDYLDNGIDGVLVMDTIPNTNGYLNYSFNGVSTDATLTLLQKALMDDSINVLVDLSENQEG